MINLTKSAMLRQGELGYSTIALLSTIPHAGRGLFVDGFAPAGSIVAFFPGSVWPKEYLLNMNTNSSLFKEDPNLQLSIRYDDILIDSRKSPYTVLSNKMSNPFAIAHIANHPPLLSQIISASSKVPTTDSVVPPNCSTVMINFTEKMNLKKRDLQRYMPNTYARPPMLLGPTAFDRDVIELHGIGLMASRDVCNEELFYDYRLSPGQGEYPDWYTIVDEEELRNRWYSTTPVGKTSN